MHGPVRFCEVLLLSVVASVTGLSVPSSCVAQSPTTWPDRTPVEVASGTQGVVASTNGLASDVGAAVLAEGGNAVDAAVATGFALAVTWPEAGNIGGGGFMMIAPPGKDVVCIEYRETAPAAVNAYTLADWKNRRHERMVGVPGTVAGFALAHDRYGKLPWQRLLQPAIDLARDGFVVDEYLAPSLNGVLERESVQSDPRYAEFVRVYGPDGKRFWEPGDRLVQPDLAETLSLIAEQGPAAFYEGPVAGKLVAQMEQGGGMITADDLENYSANERPAIHGTFQGYDFYGAPPPSSGGTTVLMELRMIDELGLTPDPDRIWTVQHVHLMTEVMRRAFRERAAHLGDPDFVEIDKKVWSPDHARRLAGSINPEQATPSEEIAGEISLMKIRPKESPQTTHFSVLDKDGTGVSNTYTLEQSFGSFIVVKGAGFLLNNEMGDFNPVPGVTDEEGRIGTPPNLMAPGKRMLSSQSPVIVRKDGRVKLLAGSPGGRTIINTVTEVLVQTLLFGRSLAEAVDAPRFHHQWFPDVLRLEGYDRGVFTGMTRQLREMGHTVAHSSGSKQGSVHAIEVDLESGVATGVSDWRRGGRPAAVHVKPESSTTETEYMQAIQKLKAAVEYEVERKELPAFSISLVDDDRVVWADGFGFQDAEQKQPATARTVYRVGSISKLFTDMAVMQLVEEGMLDLDKPIQEYLPDFQPTNPYGIPLTLRQMMSHRSGLVRESPVGNYFDPTEPTLAETVASLNDTTLVYKPETKTKYSNAAVAVVGAVLESQLDNSHPERVRQSILDPLGMHESGFVVTPAMKPHLATGWMRTYDDRRFEAPTFLLGTGPAGNLYSSVLDLSKFLVCLFNDGKTESGQLVDPETLTAMTTPRKDSGGKPQTFGLGFHVHDLDGYRKIGHGGAVYGFSTQLEALPERKIGVAAVSSLDGTNGVAGRLADYALRLMIAAQDGKPLPDYPRTGPVPPERARELVGYYQEADGNRWAYINELNGDLFLKGGTFRHELRAAASDGSILTDDESGFGTKVELQDADTLSISKDSLQRLPDEPPADIPERWKGLIGEYGWDHNTLYILEVRGRLYALIEWFYYYPLKEVGENEFEFPDYGLYHGEGLKFTRNPDGYATQVLAAEVKFDRREVGTKDGETFKITPVKPIDELRAGALAASPPQEEGDYREPDLVDLTTLDETIKLDVRYATTDNFTGAVFYKQPRAFMQRPAAEAVVRSNRRLKERGLGLLIHDAYRPWFVTKMFWDATPDDLKDFVANPAHGSRHNRGCAVDLTLYDLQTGEPIQTVAGYDEFSPRSFPLYPGGTSRQRWYRDLLRRTMEAEGFTIYEYEWWHFDFKDWKKYRIGNVTFEQIDEE